MSAGAITLIRRGMNRAMLHRCTIERGSSGTYSTPSTWDDHLTNQPCLFDERVTEERVEGGGVRMVKRSVILLPSGTDITSGDRVTSVTDQLDTELLPRAYAVDGDPTIHSSHVAAALIGVS
jgi:hypothetical protein